jgi:hypothetical protein
VSGNFYDDPFASGPQTNDESQSTRFNMIRLSALVVNTGARWVVEDLLPRNGLAVIWGEPSCGKSFWTFDLAGHIALGRPFGERNVEAGSALYIACEGESGVIDRAVAFRQERIEADEDPPLFLMQTCLDLITDIDALIEAIRAQHDEPLAVIVVDTLNRSLRGSENKDEDMSAYVRAADQLRIAFGCLVILIHHCGVAGERPRGHTSLTGAVDTQIAVRNNAGVRTATVEKLRDGPAGGQLIFTLQVVEIGLDDRGKTISSCVIKRGDEVMGTQPRQRPHPKLRPAQKTALARLADAINTGGEKPPFSQHIPENAVCVTEEIWRQFCYQGGISTGGQEAKRKAFTNAADTLIGDGRVGSWDGWVWLPSQP